MKTIKMKLPLAAIFVSVTILLASCGGPRSGAGKSADSTAVNGPVPDNNSATNPSSADTAYQKDSTRKISDTSHH